VGGPPTKASISVLSQSRYPRYLFAEPCKSNFHGDTSSPSTWHRPECEIWYGGSSSRAHGAIRCGLYTVVWCPTYFWSMPVVLSGSMSQITTFASTISWLNWLARQHFAGRLVEGRPHPHLSVPTCSAVAVCAWRILERSLQKYYLAIFTQNFLTICLASSITAVAQGVAQSRPRDVSSLNIPKSSNYLFSYLTLQGLPVSVGSMVQIGALFATFALGA
jgi:calcium permeable stress-gated cation channel